MGCGGGHCVSPAIKRRAHLLKHTLQLAHNELRIQTQHAVSESLESSISPRIGAMPSGMIRAIDLDDQPASGREKVDDELAEHDLPSKVAPELRA